MSSGRHAAAEASGLLGMHAATPAEVVPALQRALAHPGPALVEVMVNRRELSVPPTVTLAQAKGFSLYRARAILNGRGDEVLDLATSKDLFTESLAVGKAIVR